MESASIQTRQLKGCGYLPPPDEKLRPLVRPWSGLGYSGDPLTTCPGYTTALPEVIEVRRARLHWSKGALREFCGTDPATSALVVGVELANYAANECDAWCMENRDP